MKLTGLFALATVWAGTAQAQEMSATSHEQQLVEAVGLERLPAGVVRPALANVQNVTGLLQTGNGNVARIDQQTLANTGNQAYIAQVGEANILGLSQMGGNNRLYVAQNGSGNAAAYSQEGQNNSTSITQNGTQNRIHGVKNGSDLVLAGDNNTMKITQTGDNNTVKGDVRESNRTYEIRQYGRDNTLTQVESTLQTPKGYTVEMRGQGINLSIEQSKVTVGH